MTTTPGENVTVEARLAVLETQMEAVQEGQRQIIARLDTMEQLNDARFDSMNARFDSMTESTNARFDSMAESTNARFVNARFDSLNSRFDRLFYTILGLGMAAIGTMIALDKVL